MTERCAFVLAARQQLRADFITRRTFDATLAVASVLFATLQVLALGLAQKFFGARMFLGEVAASAFLLDQLLEERN